MTNPCVLYRMYGADGVLLYVGATMNPGRRIYVHSRSQPWWDEASEIRLERFDTWEDLNDAEVSAIQIERPRYNIAESENGRWRPYKPRRTKGDGAFFQRADGVWIGRVELPGNNGRRRFRCVSSKDYGTALLKFDRLRADLQATGVSR